ncbi:hypothetical protein [Ulvibacter antarcticus]|uniref:PH (Pleckstrin Homology) domain-containing protein n=1 Tax=Ulvibacter antarcticus TaxID=442714 RepID=A0A3L9YGB5_9FLAO|nr:hypothetical protein [Ulvibacter antarcticus]RMA58470.1 hypothetical protein BXY75_1843 [Ulvibacter antarcticus]
MKSFSETQGFDQWWFRALMLVVLVVIIVGLVNTFPTFKDNMTAMISSLGFSLIGVLIIMLVLFYLKLETRIDEQGIQYGFWPFQLNLKLIPWRDISQCYVRKYSPITEYGGWGYRSKLFSQNPRAMNVKGNIGIQIVLKDGKKLLIGTQQKDTVEKVLKTYSHKIEHS